MCTILSTTGYQPYSMFFVGGSVTASEGVLADRPDRVSAGAACSRIGGTEGLANVSGMAAKAHPSRAEALRPLLLLPPLLPMRTSPPPPALERLGGVAAEPPDVLQRLGGDLRGATAMPLGTAREISGAASGGWAELLRGRPLGASFASRSLGAVCSGGGCGRNCGCACGCGCGTGCCGRTMCGTDRCRAFGPQSAADLSADVSDKDDAPKCGPNCVRRLGLFTQLCSWCC